MLAEDVLDAKLYLYYTGKEGTDESRIDLYGLSNSDKTSWDESLTANDATTLGLFDDADETNRGPGTHLGRTTDIDADAPYWVEIDVTEYVKTQEDGVYAFRFFGASSKTTYNTREIAGFEPYIDIATGDTGAARAAVRDAAVPSAIYKSVTLPAVVDGEPITYTSDDEEISIAGNEVTVTGTITQATPVTITATATVNGKTASKAVNVTLQPEMFSFGRNGEELSVLTTDADNPVVAGTHEGLTLPAGTRLYIAAYDTEGKLVEIYVMDTGASKKFTVTDNIGMLAAYVWNGSLKPVEAEAISR